MLQLAFMIVYTRGMCFTDIYINLPASLSMRFNSSIDFMARNLLGVRVQICIFESPNPADIRLESSHISSDVKLKITKNMTQVTRL